MNFPWEIQFFCKKINERHSILHKPHAILLSFQNHNLSMFFYELFTARHTLFPLFADPQSTFPPRIIDRKVNIRALQGSTVEMPCAAEGYPIPEIHWLKLDKNQALRMSKTQRYLQLGGNLIIRRAEPEDSGKYVCYVNNTVADERVDTELLVAGESIFLN